MYKCVIIVECYADCCLSRICLSGYSFKLPASRLEFTQKSVVTYARLFMKEKTYNVQEDPKK
jgi:hypothetical protein